MSKEIKKKKHPLEQAADLVIMIHKARDEKKDKLMGKKSSPKEEMDESEMEAQDEGHMPFKKGKKK